MPSPLQEEQTIEDEEEEELEPLFDYRRVQPNLISIDEDDSEDFEKGPPKESPKRIKKSDSVECLNDKSCEETVKVVVDDEEKEEDWLLPPPVVAKPAQTLEKENATLQALRLKKQELASFALAPQDILRAVEESARKNISSSDSETPETPESKAEPPPKAPDSRAKIVISIQDKDELKQFRVYMDDKFERLFRMYAERVKRDIQSLVFCFDGDKVNSSSTPEGLGMEDNDIIEVHFKSS